jgi:4-oxalocrotonate tautomerase
LLIVNRFKTIKKEDNMPLVTVEMWEGRTVEQKRELAKAITSAVAGTIDCPEEAVEIIIRDVPKHNWAVGGKLASDRF